MNYFARIFSYFAYLWYVLTLGMKLKYDLIIASSTPLTVAMPAIILKTIKRAKLVFEIRDLWPQLPIAIGVLKSSILKNMALYLEQKVYTNSDQIIVLSPGMATELNGKVHNRKLSVITNLSDLHRFQIPAKKGIKFRENFPEIANNPLVLYAGAFGRINRVSYLVEIAGEIIKINPHIRFLLAGDGYEKERLVEHAKELNLLNNTLFITDYFPKDQMPKLLSASTITTSFFIDLKEMEYNSANKFFDGLAAGKPIMINYGGWQADLLLEHKAGFIIPNNNSLKAAKILNDVIIDDNSLQAMSQAARSLANRFDIDTNYAKFKTVIDRAHLA
jgi:glycosyltransferase involved in cell wall biosynthesis